MIRTVIASLCLIALANAWAETPGPNPQQTLDQLDTRTPVPLLPMMANHQKANMRDHLQAIQEIIAALTKNDFAGIEEAVKQIGYSDQAAQMCQHMGAATPGFTELGMKFHRTADTIGTAARTKDTKGLLTALSDTLANCASCHAQFKQQVVDEAALLKLTGKAPPLSTDMHSHH